jgi:hypothetical protein
MNTPTDRPPDHGTGGADDELMALLKRALEREDPVPADAVRVAKEAWTWRSIDAELAALTYDSAVDTSELAGVRGGPATATRALSFEGAEMLLDVEVTDDGERRLLLGQLAPAGPPAVGLEFADGRPPVVLLTDELGRFGAERLDPGLLRLRVEPADPGSPGGTGGLVTAWVPI